MPPREVSRCFALMANDDTSTATCRFRQGKKTKAGKIVTPPAVSFDKGKTTETAHLLGTITLERNVHMEVWQTQRFLPTMAIEDVWNIPLFDDLATFPVIFRVTAPNSELLPTVGRARKLLASRLQASASTIADEDDAEHAHETLPPLEDFSDEEDDEEDDDHVPLDDETDEEEEDEGEEDEVEDEEDEEDEEEEEGDEDEDAEPNDEDY